MEEAIALESGCYNHLFQRRHRIFFPVGSNPVKFLFSIFVIGHIYAPCPVITLKRQCSLGGIWPPNVCHFVCWLLLSMDKEK
jgi:hypothetical protein